MEGVEKPAPKKLKLVRLDGPLGDLSHMTPAERAEIVQQDGRRRIFEEIVSVEMAAWRSFFLWGGMCVGGWSLGVLVRVGMRFLYGAGMGLPSWLWNLLMLLVGVSVLVGVVSFLPAVVCFAKLLVAMHRRRRLGRSGSLQEP